MAGTSSYASRRPDAAIAPILADARRPGTDGRARHDDPGNRTPLAALLPRRDPEADRRVKGKRRSDLALHSRTTDPGSDDALSVRPQFSQHAEIGEVPRLRLARNGMPPATAFQIIHDELMLDGNARLNLATFVTTWMEPEAELLMAECASKNMIDKDEYPQTAEIERRCVNILARLWHAERQSATGCSTTGSSEACMLGGLALKWRWRQRRGAAGLPTDRPNLVMGANVQVCWEKFCRYFDVEARLVPVGPETAHLTPGEAAAACDEHTIGVVAVLGSTYDGAYEPVAGIAAALDDLDSRGGPDVPMHVDGASGALGGSVSRPGARVGLPDRARPVDQRLRPQVRPRLPGRGMGPVAGGGGVAGRARVQGQLPRRRDADVRARTSRVRVRRWSRSTTTSCGSGRTDTARCKRPAGTRPDGWLQRSKSLGRSPSSRGRKASRCSPSG